MLEKLSVTIDLEISYDTGSNTFVVEKSNTRINTTNQPAIIKMERVLQVAEIRYGILTLGSKSSIGKILPLDEDITVIFKDITLQAHTHKTSPGRIDRLSSIIKQFPEKFRVGKRLEVEYHIVSKELYIL